MAEGGKSALARYLGVQVTLHSATAGKRLRKRCLVGGYAGSYSR